MAMREYSSMLLVDGSLERFLASITILLPVCFSVRTKSPFLALELPAMPLLPEVFSRLHPSSGAESLSTPNTCSSNLTPFIEDLPSASDLPCCWFMNCCISAYLCSRFFCSAWKGLDSLPGSSTDSICSL